MVNLSVSIRATFEVNVIEREGWWAMPTLLAWHSLFGGLEL